MDATEAIDEAKEVILGAIDRIKDEMASGACSTIEEYREAVGAVARLREALAAIIASVTV